MPRHRGIVEHHEPEHHVSEGMEKWKDAEDSLILIQMEHLGRTLAIRIDAEMGEHDALGFSGAAAAEDDGRQAIGSQRGGLPAGPFDHTDGREEGKYGGL